MITKNALENTGIWQRWEIYIAGVEAAIGQELDENTRRELRWAYLGGACAAFGLMSAASHKTQAEHDKAAQEIVDVGMALAAEMNQFNRVRVQ